jgi:hypothetical protein
MSRLLSALCLIITTNSVAQELQLRRVLSVLSKNRFLADGLPVPNANGLQGSTPDVQKKERGLAFALREFVPMSLGPSVEEIFVSSMKPLCSKRVGSTNLVTEQKGLGQIWQDTKGYSRRVEAEQGP